MDAIEYISGVIEDSGGVDRHLAVVEGATAKQFKKPTAANQKIAGWVVRGNSTQNKPITITKGVKRIKWLVKAASPAIVYGDKVVIHGTSGGGKKATTTSSVTTSGAAATNKNTLTSVLTGRFANLISIEYRNDGTNNQTLLVTVKGLHIDVRLATDGAAAATSTSEDVRAALAASAAALRLLTAANAGDGLGVVTAAHYHLTGADILDEGYYATAREAASADDVEIWVDAPYCE